MPLQIYPRVDRSHSAEPRALSIVAEYPWNTQGKVEGELALEQVDKVKVKG